jgi:ABC-type spermidine/putrescine transport system permease subunit I
MTVDVGLELPSDRRRSNAIGLLARPCIQVWGGLLPVVLWQLVFFVVPLGLLLIYSFWSLKNFRLDTSFTLENYSAILQNPIVGKALLLSFEIALAVTFVCGLLAYPVAYFIAKRAGRWRVFLLIAVIVPFWTSLVLRAFAWKLLLGENGVINKGLSLAGLIDAPFAFLLYSPVATGIGLVYAYLPLYVLPLYSSIDKVQDSWLEAAMDLGASPLRAFWEVTFPLCLPGLLVGAVFCFIFGFGEYVIPQLLGGGKQLVFAQVIIMEFDLAQNWPGGAALSMLMLVVVAGVLLAAFRWTNIRVAT